MKPRVEKQLEDWRVRAWIAQVAHYRAAGVYGRCHLVVSSVCLVLATGVTIAIAGIDTAENPNSKWVVVTASGVSGLCAQAMALWAFRSRSNDHRRAAVKFSHMKRQIEHELAVGNGGVMDFLGKVLREFNEVTEESPVVPDAVFRSAERVVAELRELDGTKDD